MQKHTRFQEITPILLVLGKNKMNFGQLLKQYRKAKGLTQEELAVAAGINVSYVSNLERNFSSTAKGGTPTASPELCDRLEKVLDVPRSELRLAAGHLPKNGSGIPYEIIITGFEGLDEDDVKEIAEFMRFKKAQKQKGG